jgi:putative FmdB family regulatory protein
MVYECQDCGTKFSDMEQTNQEYRNGQCPSCGHEDLKEIPERSEGENRTSN